MSGVLILNELASRITDRRWREVFLLTVEILLEADNLLILINRKIDTLSDEAPELQKILKWVLSKSKLDKVSHGDIVARAFYFAHTLSFICHLDCFSFRDTENAMQARVNIALLKVLHQRRSAFAINLDKSLENFEIQVQTMVRTIFDKKAIHRIGCHYKQSAPDG